MGRGWRRRRVCWSIHWLWQVMWLRRGRRDRGGRRRSLRERGSCCDGSGILDGVCTFLVSGVPGIGCTVFVAFLYTYFRFSIPCMSTAFSRATSIGINTLNLLLDSAHYIFCYIKLRVAILICLCLCFETAPHQSLYFMLNACGYGRVRDHDHAHPHSPAQDCFAD